MKTSWAICLRVLVPWLAKCGRVALGGGPLPARPTLNILRTRAGFTTFQRSQLSVELSDALACFPDAGPEVRRRPRFFSRACGPRACRIGVFAAYRSDTRV